MQYTNVDGYWRIPSAYFGNYKKSPGFESQGILSGVLGYNHPTIFKSP